MVVFAGCESLLRTTRRAVFSWLRSPGALIQVNHCRSFCSDHPRIPDIFRQAAEPPARAASGLADGGLGDDDGQGPGARSGEQGWMARQEGLA